MVLEIQKGMLVALQTGRLKDAGKLRPEQISFGKLNNVREAIAICRSARTILGGNGVTLEHSPLRHADNLESVRTYEGTDEVHTLIMGRAITGIAGVRGCLMETLTIDVDDRLAVVTITRPEVRNALSRQVLAELRDALAELRERDDVGLVAITGAGEKAFVAGADIAQLRHYDLHTGLDAEMQRTFDTVEAFPKPTVAAVNGFALGGGCELAMACDIRIASENARFGLPETTLSVLPGAGGTQRLARLVGTGRAIEMILTGRFVDAAEAHAIGLITAVVPAEGLRAELRRLADQILAKGPLAVRLAKLVVRAGMDADQRTGQVVEQLAQALLYTTADKAEGASAFLEKRAPTFKGV